MKRMTMTGMGLWVLLCLGSVLAFGADKITWEHVVLGPGGGWRMIKIDPQNDDVVYVSSDMRCWFKSTDGGKTWSDLTPAQMEATCRGGVWDYGLLIDPKDQNTLYVASGGVAKSMDGGKSWKLVSDAFFGGGAFGCRMAMNPTDSKVMYLGRCYGNLIKTENAGNTWTNLPGTSWGQFRKNQPDLVNIMVGHDHAVYVCMFGKGIFKSADGGQTWTTNNVGLPLTTNDEDFPGRPFLEIISFQAAVEKNRTVLYALLSKKRNVVRTAGDMEKGLYRSLDGAKTWEKVKVLDEEKYKGCRPPLWCQMAVSPVNPDVVYLTAKEVLEEWGSDGTYRTLDGGKTWQFFGGRYDRDIWGWRPIMFQYAGTFGDMFAVSPRNPKKLYRANQSCVYRSDDGGESWQRLSREDAGEGYSRSTGLEDIAVLGIQVDSTDSRRVYVTTMDNGFFKSRDGGKTWKAGYVKGLGIRTERTSQIMVDPDVPSTLYIGVANFPVTRHFAISRDYGETWEKSETHPEWGLPQLARVIALALDPDSPADSRVLYASLIGDGVWKTENGGLKWKPRHNGLPEVTPEPPEGIAGRNLADRQIEIIQLVKPKGTEIVYALAATNVQDLMNYITGQGSLYVTENKGESWHNVQSEGPCPAIAKIAVDPKNPAILYAACRKEGVWKSADKGKTWKKILFVEPGVPFDQVAVDNFNSSRVYASGVIDYTSNYGVWMSEDGGNTWTHESKGFGHSTILALYADPTAEGIIWAGTMGNAVFKGYIKGVASPKEIKEPARSPLEEKKSPLKALTNTEILEQIKSASLSAVKADASITIDGDLAEPAWAKATAVTGFYDIRTRTLAEKQTTVKALYDREFLYLGIICQEPNPDLLKAELCKHDGNVWNSDAVEVFIATGLKGDVFQFVANAAGSRWDAAYGHSQQENVSWNPEPDWQAAVRKGKNEWTMELAIPLKAMPGNKGEPWRIKICRDDLLTPCESTWPVSVLDGFLCPPAQFAPVMLGSAGAGKTVR